MRSLVIYRHDFNYYLYPAVVNVPSESETELETSLRVIRKLKDPRVSAAKPITDDQRAKLEAGGGRVYSLYKLIDDQANLLLQEDEWNLVLARLRKSIPMIESAFAEDLLDLLRRVKDAPNIPDTAA